MCRRRQWYIPQFDRDNNMGRIDGNDVSNSFSAADPVSFSANPRSTTAGRNNKIVPSNHLPAHYKPVWQLFSDDYSFG